MPATAAVSAIKIETPSRDDRLNGLAGTVAPHFTLDLLGGGRLSLGDLLAQAKPLVLMFTDPRCGPCYEVLPDLGGWQRVYGDRLSFALISVGDAATNRALTAEYGIHPVLLQLEREVADAYGLVQAPAALMIAPDGRVAAGPRYGANSIRQLVADTLGLEMPEAPSREIQVVGVGEMPSRLRRPNLDGRMIEIGGPGPEPTLVVFWSPGCSGCQTVLPDIRAAEESVERLRMVVVSRGAIGLNQEVGFRSPVVLDDDHSLAQTFGVNGTPSALLLDHRGVVVTEVARGSDGVHIALNAVRAMFAPAPAAD
jgi:thiol-disulfide isomerase/thioredoxin